MSLVDGGEVQQKTKRPSPLLTEKARRLKDLGLGFLEEEEKEVVVNIRGEERRQNQNWRRRGRTQQRQRNNEIRRR